MSVEAIQKPFRALDSDAANEVRLRCQFIEGVADILCVLDGNKCADGLAVGSLAGVMWGVEKAAKAIREELRL